MTETNELIAVSVVPQKAAIIDDAFDDVIEGEVPLETFLKFHQKHEEPLEKARINLGWEKFDLQEFEEDDDAYLAFLQKIWDNRNHPDLVGLINHTDLFFAKLQNIEELETLCENLKEQNIEIETFQSTIPAAATFYEKGFLYIFIDYNLGSTSGSVAQENARKVAMEIYQQYPLGEKPMTILMSNDPSITSKKEEFKEKAGLLEGIFRVSPKGDLTDKNKISLLAKAYQEAFKSNDALQDYISALIKASEDAQEDFKKQVRELSIDDYEFIQEMKLKKPQQPLGDYLGWLYGSLWSDLLSKSKKLKPTEHQLNTIVSHKSPLFDSIPSKKLAEIFTIALFETDLGDVQDHPWTGKAKGQAHKHLHLGDIFTSSGSSTIFMVLNPQCDLERPFGDAKDQSILLIPGELEPFDKLSAPSALRTGLFNHENKRYKIDWLLKKIMTVPLGEFDKWMKKENLERTYRLRLIYALEIQQKFTSHMSRVGLPEAPPLTSEIKATFHYKNWQKNSEHTKLWESNDSAFMIISNDNKNKLRPTLKFGLELKSSIFQVLKQLEAEKTEVEGSVPQNLEKRIKSLSEFLNEFDSWFLKNEDFAMPVETQSAMMEKIIAISYNATELAEKFQTSPFWISIENPDSFSAEQASA